MTFARKVFAAIFVSTLLVGTLLIWVSYSLYQKRAELDFKNRYSSLTRVLSDALTRLDISTEALMRNAALVIADREKKGPISTDELRDLRTMVGVTHAFIINSDGEFIRSTNEDPKKIPNLFSFSPEYRRLLSGELEVESTPVITPKPERDPFKFLSVASYDKKRIIEVAVRVDFIANTLVEAVKSDDGVQSMTLYSPDGSQFGMFSANGVTFNRNKARLPFNFSHPDVSGSAAHFFSLVASSHEQCSQCDVAKTSIDGKYYYVLESTVSTASLVYAKSVAAQVAAFFLILNCFVSWFAATLISKRLVKNIRLAVARVRQISEGGSPEDRVGLSDGTEISYLTREFDRLLDRLVISQQQALETKILSSKIELAKVVAHNIKSPLLALDMTLPSIEGIPDGAKKVVRSAIDEIKNLANDLQRASQGDHVGFSNLKFETFCLDEMVAELVEQKKLEYQGQFSFEFKTSPTSPATVRANRSTLRSVFSNILNNAVEAQASNDGSVSVEVERIDNLLNIRFQDEGEGMDELTLSQIGSRAISSKAGIGRGIGLVHAKSAIEANGGKLRFDSKRGQGTTVSVSLPLAP